MTIRRLFAGLTIGILILGAASTVVAETPDEQIKTLIGEWKGVWPGFYGDTSTLVIHEIDRTTAKAQCTYTVYQKDKGKTEFKVLADFIPGPNPKLEFKTVNNSFTCVLKDKRLEISFVGSVRGFPMSNATVMEKTIVQQIEATSQIIAHIDQILKENPLKPGAKVQMIPIAQDDTISLSVVRSIEGFMLKPHYHKTHDETICVIKGTGQILINGQWVDIKPGSLHFNPMGKVHATKHTGDEPLVSISIFTPALKEPDRHFVE